MTINLWTRSTDVSTLQECQMKYLLGRLYDTDDDASWFAFGSAVHKGIETFIDSNTTLAVAKKIAANYLYNELESFTGRVRWTKKRPEEGVFERLGDLLDKWYDDFNDDPYLGMDSVATEFKIHTPIPNTDTSLVTTVDWLADYAGVPVLVDWKSGATAKAAPLQLQIYAWGATHDARSPFYGMDANDLQLWYHHVAFSRDQTVEYPGDEYVESVLQWAVGQKERIMESEFAPARPDWYCDYCLYQSKCPLFGGKLAQVKYDLSQAAIEINPVEGSNG